MTENKRFKKISVCGDWGIKDVQNDTVLFFATTDEVNDTFEVLNELNNQVEAVREELQLCEEENTELQKENEQLYELVDFVNTLIVFKSSESCQMEWEKRLKELKSE